MIVDFDVKWFEFDWMFYFFIDWSGFDESVWVKGWYYYYIF